MLKHFPPVVFKLKGQASVEINYEGIAPAGEALVPWDKVKALQYNASSFGDSLTVTLNEKGMLGAKTTKTTKIKLSGLGKQRDAFNDTAGHYWRRYQIMRSQQ